VASDGISITGGPDHHQVCLEQDGQIVAAADVDFTTAAGTVRAVLHSRVQPLPAHIGRRLVDAVVDLLEGTGATQLNAAVSAVDVEMVQRLRERTHDVSTRLAGTTTVLITAHPAPSPAAPSTPKADRA